MLNIFILFEILYVIRGLTILWNSNKKYEYKDRFDPLSVVIPIKGWDPTLPNLISNLLNQNDFRLLQIIIVIDSNNPHKDEIPDDDRVLLLQSESRPIGWQDKNWRLYQGTCHCQYSPILFLDSDVSIDKDFLKNRISMHNGDFSYSVPLYKTLSSATQKFLAAFTNYHNFHIYKFSTSIMNIGTAVGPCLLINLSKDILLDCILENKNEIADDHAFGYWFKRKNYIVTCTTEPVYVTKNNPSWSEVLSQIKRWILLPKTVLHLLIPLDTILTSINILLNFIPSLCFYVGLSSIIFGNSLLTSFLIAALTYIFTETIFLIVIEKSYSKRVYFHYPWAHFLFLPLIFVAQPILALQSHLSKKFEWRGETYKTRFKI